MKYLIFIVMMVAGISATACVQRQNNEFSATQHISSFLPPDAKKVSYLGNGWATFELDDGVKTRRFLYRRFPYAFSNSSASVECITELRP